MNINTNNIKKFKEKILNTLKDYKNKIESIEMHENNNNNSLRQSYLMDVEAKKDYSYFYYYLIGFNYCNLWSNLLLWLI